MGRRSIVVATLGLAAVVAAGTVGIGNVQAAGAWELSSGQDLPRLRTTTLTGALVERVFIQDCRCYPWVIEKNGRSFEVDISRVERASRALKGLTVRAIGRWSSYQRDNQTIRYFVIERLERV